MSRNKNPFDEKAAASWEQSQENELRRERWQALAGFFVWIAIFILAFWMAGGF